MPFQFRAILCFFTLPILFSLSAQHAMAEVDKEHELSLRNALEQRILEIQSNPELYHKMLTEAKERTTLCETCHGKDGMAITPLTPNLAGQNPAYLVDQFQRFGDGRRNDYWMSSLSKTFSDEEKIKLALYYASMEMKASGGGRPDLLEEGKTLFQSTCVSCHGEDAKGQEGYARLAGQRPDYVMKMLKEFRDRTGKRINLWMTSVAIRLSDRDIEAVAAYLASLN